MSAVAWLMLTKVTRQIAEFHGNDYRWMLHRCAMLLPVNGG